MTNIERIVQSYRNRAVSSAEMIDILADLNGCSRRDIIGVLTSRGIEIPKSKKRIKWTIPQVEKLEKMCQDGHTREQMASVFETTVGAINGAIYSYGIVTTSRK